MSADPVGTLSTEESRALPNQWRALRRAATGVALLTSPALFVWLYHIQEMAIGWAIVTTLVRGGPVPGLSRPALPPSRGLLALPPPPFIAGQGLFGVDSERLREEDVVARRRVWFWRYWYR